MPQVSALHGKRLSFTPNRTRNLEATPTFDDIIASRGGIPLVEEGELIGVIDCSGGAGSQDEAACMVGAATMNK